MSSSIAYPTLCKMDHVFQIEYCSGCQCTILHHLYCASCISLSPPAPLSGESIPMMKTPLPMTEERYSTETQRRHTLFCGTQAIQAKGGCPGGRGAVAVVVSTGYTHYYIIGKVN